MSEVLGVFVATLLGFTLMNPVHLLFINLITDCFPALALGLEKGEPDVMERRPAPLMTAFSPVVWAGTSPIRASSLPLSRWSPTSLATAWRWGISKCPRASPTTA